VFLFSCLAPLLGLCFFIYGALVWTWLIGWLMWWILCITRGRSEHEKALMLYSKGLASFTAMKVYFCARVPPLYFVTLQALIETYLLWAVNLVLLSDWLAVAIHLGVWWCKKEGWASWIFYLPTDMVMVSVFCCFGIIYWMIGWDFCLKNPISFNLNSSFAGQMK